MNEKGPVEYLAHSENRGGLCEPLRDHLSAVASRAAAFASACDGKDQGRAAGLLHDLGKYARRFQRRVKGESDARAGDHAMLGAILALQCYKSLGCMPAAAILGHHGGLDVLQRDWSDWLRRLCEHVHQHPEKVTEPDLAALLERFRKDGFELPNASVGLRPNNHDADDMLDTRMLFSALVDADFLETEAHFEGDAYTPRRERSAGPLLEPVKALTAVEEHIARLQAGGDADSPMNAARATLHQQCLTAADRPTGLFTLSAPTGSGKTLSMLAFALKHASVHGLRRIVLVMPYLNIIDQTVGLYRDLFNPEAGFPDNYVLEDHSLAGRDAEDNGTRDEDKTRRLLAENWDAPIVLTTTVRCLESLLSNRPSDCRKLHRLAKSVLLFDEVQTIPKELAVGTLGAISRLSERFGSTVVFATATQPAFDHLDGAVEEIAQSGWKPRPVVPTEAEAELFAASSGRTKIRWEQDSPLSLDALADRLAGEQAEQWMCIVNIKRHAQELFGLLRSRGAEGLVHLSTSMCPMHRERVLADIRERLDTGRPVRLVSTQCVEAGVDVDFAVVYRAMAPLEAVAQAAGRCNRHGRRPGGGRVHVFKPTDDEGRTPCPPGAYATAASVTETFVGRLLSEGHRGEALIHDPELIQRYYRELYELTGTGQAGDGREKELRKAMECLDFQAVANVYRLIPDASINILVDYDEAEFQRLRDEMDEIRSRSLRRPGELRKWIAAARRMSVGHLFRAGRDAPILQHLDPVHFGRPTGEGKADWYIALRDLKYDNDLGLIEPDELTCIV